MAYGIIEMLVLMSYINLWANVAQSGALLTYWIWPFRWLLSVNFQYQVLCILSLWTVFFFGSSDLVPESLCRTCNLGCVIVINVINNEGGQTFLVKIRDIKENLKINGNFCKKTEPINNLPWTVDFVSHACDKWYDNMFEVMTKNILIFC